MADLRSAAFGLAGLRSLNIADDSTMQGLRPIGRLHVTQTGEGKGGSQLRMRVDNPTAPLKGTPVFGFPPLTTAAADAPGSL